MTSPSHSVILNLFWIWFPINFSTLRNMKSFGHEMSASLDRNIILTPTSLHAKKWIRLMVFACWKCNRLVKIFEFLLKQLWQFVSPKTNRNFLCCRASLDLDLFSWTNNYSTGHKPALTLHAATTERHGSCCGRRRNYSTSTHGQRVRLENHQNMSIRRDKTSDRPPLNSST